GFYAQHLIQGKDKVDIINFLSELSGISNNDEYEKLMTQLKMGNISTVPKHSLYSTIDLTGFEELNTTAIRDTRERFEAMDIKEYSFIDIKKGYFNGYFKEMIYGFYWDIDTDGNAIKKYDLFENLDYYFYVDPKELEKKKFFDIRICPGDFTTVNGKQCTKIEPVKKLNANQFRELRSRFSVTYEADIPALTRWIGKNKPKYSKRVKKIYLDIECIKDTKGQYSSPATGEAPIIMITCYDNFDKQYHVFSYKKVKFKKENINIIEAVNEKQMLENFIDYIEKRNPDYLLGWNIESYDIPYILKRMDNLDLQKENLSIIKKVYYKQTTEISSHKFSSFFITIGGTGIFDLMSASQRLWLGKYCGYSLNKMSKEYLNQEKIDVNDIDYSYEHEFDKLIEYNIKDVELCIELDDKLELFKKFQSFQDIISINVNNTLVMSQNIVQYFLQMTNTILLTAGQEQQKTFKGAIVLDSVPGIFEKCYKFDFASMYPSIILTYNISPDTILTSKEEDCINMNNEFFFSKKKGIVTKDGGG
ncbi:hypothetical protein LCGC14_2406610, partial [marine sediment metagenome]